MNTRLALLLIPALTLGASLAAQEKKPAAPKTSVHAPTQSKLNKIRQDERTQKLLKKAMEEAGKAGKNSETVKREAERIQKEKSPPGTDEAQAKLEKLKNSLDEKDRKELEALLKDSTEAMREKYLDRKPKEGAPAPAVNPVPEDSPAQGSFDSIAAPEPIPLVKAPVFPVAPIRADRAIRGPSRDPKNPEKMLPESDPRTRTWVLSGNVKMRRPTEAVDGDEVEVVFKQGESPDSSGEKKKPAPPPNADPINRPKSEDSPIESIVARGRVRFMIVDKTGRVQVGRGGHMTYDAKSGWFVIKDWPEAEFQGLLLKGRTKNSVIRLGRLEEVDMTGLDAYTLEKELTTEDLPKTADKPVPNAGAVLPKPSAAPAPAPR